MTRQATMTTFTCKEIQAILDEADWQAVMPTAVVKHCADCRECQGYEKQLTALRGLLSSPERIAAPADFDIKLRQRIVTRQRTVEWGWRPFLWQSALGTATAMILILGVLVGKDWYQARQTPAPVDVAMEQPTANVNVVANPAPSTPVTTAVLPAPEKIVTPLPPPVRVTTRSIATTPVSERRPNNEVVEPTIIYGAQPIVESAAEEDDVATIF